MIVIHGSIIMSLFMCKYVFISVHFSSKNCPAIKLIFVGHNLINLPSHLAEQKIQDKGTATLHFYLLISHMDVYNQCATQMQHLYCESVQLKQFENLSTMRHLT